LPTICFAINYSAESASSYTTLQLAGVG